MLEQLRRQADEEPRGLLDRLCREWKDGGIKLYLTDKALGLRKKRPILFQDGSYLPVSAAGEHAESVCAFARRRENVWSLSVTPRWTSRLISNSADSLTRMDWGDTVLRLPEEAPRSWQDVLSMHSLEAKDQELRLETLLARFPVALLEGLAGG
jgi:(1->4)-alpha-D-glucan 1-alpha-D-glucosylmutase